mmetsp:Transcript_3016/g.6938  ORF Transcript_3016/g.6938 Transcript_3016/m.6938 type:complete len:389 (-) Transcript_3016:674-1840(-)
MVGVNTDTAIGLGFCILSGILSSLGLIAMKSVITVDEEQLVEAISPSYDDAEEDSARFDELQPLGHHHRLISRRTSSIFEDFAATRDVSVEVLSRANLKWAAGLCSYTAGQALNLIALSYLEQVIWAVLSLFSLVANACFAHVLLNEELTCFDLLCTGLILIGSTLVVIANSAAVSNTAAPSVEDLIAHFSRPWFEVYAVFLAVLVLGCAIHGARSLGRGHHVHALTWTILSATCGSVSVLLGKCIVEVIGIVYHNRSSSESILSAPSTYIVLGVFVIAALGALVSLNMALAVGEALLVVPYLTVTNTLLAIMGGILYFEEFQAFQAAYSAVIFALGVTLALLGAYVLQRNRGRQNHESTQQVTKPKLTITVPRSAINGGGQGSYRTF